ncbi:MAG: hypothetical protein NC914_01500 [Candidatus Omnitrophica bacterium]|nr:hypothetical protein [Candidatus Omnitrophota bacterium]
MDAKQQLVSFVENSITDIEKKFKENPTAFFTENDLICYFYMLLCEKMRLFRVDYLDLVHREFPTFMKCDMRHKGFIPMDDNSSFSRGHFDLIIINPDLANKAKAWFTDKFQRFDFLRARFGYVKEHRERYLKQPALLYALEFMYNREPITIKEKGGIGNLIKIALQDFNKLKATQCHGGNKYAENIKMLIFIKDTVDRAVREEVYNKLEKESGGQIRCIFNN